MKEVNRGLFSSKSDTVRKETIACNNNLLINSVNNAESILNGLNEKIITKTITSISKTNHLDLLEFYIPNIDPHAKPENFLQIDFGLDQLEKI